MEKQHKGDKRVFPMLIENETAGEYKSFPRIALKKDYNVKEESVIKGECILLEDLGGNNVTDLKKKKAKPSGASMRAVIYIPKDGCVEIVSDTGVTTVMTTEGVMVWGK